ncbi:MAG: hypothetical protein JEY99_07465 [Spirochaetales bacterium]|nr:hypothetical protein [Spirochaetales bacterium]
MIGFKPGELKIVILITLGITVIGVLVSVIISIARQPDPILVEFDHSDRVEEVHMSDFIFTEEKSADEIAFKMARPLRDSWTNEELLRFWEDPGKAGLKQLSKENDEFIRSYFDAVP